MAAHRGARHVNSRKSDFSLTFAREGAPLHVSAHSHHPWPDVSRAAHLAAWENAAKLIDGKWDAVFGDVIPRAQAHIACELDLPDPGTIAFAPNTHSLVLRILSCLPASRPLRVLTTGSEFMSFARQIARLEEDGLAEVERVPAEPFADFDARFAAAAAKGGHDLVFVSQVFFDSAYRVRDLVAIVNAVPNPDTFVVIDGYHAFMAVPVDLSRIAGRAFFLAGGYKYAMAGEGACFLHCPPGYGMRPRDTGWFAGFAALEGGSNGVPFATDGSRFLGATFDVSGLCRFNAVQDWLRAEKLSTADILGYVRGLEGMFLDALSEERCAITRDELMLPDAALRGRFLAFRTPEAGEITARLAARNIIFDHRRDRLRIGFGIYNDEGDVRALVAALRA